MSEASNSEDSPSENTSETGDQAEEADNAV